MGVKSSKYYEVWVEGYRTISRAGYAWRAGIAEASSFQEACEIVFEGEKPYNKDNNTYWGCRLLDNEADARKIFG